MKQIKQADGKPRKLVINQESVRTLASHTMKYDDAVPRLTPCTRCGTTR